MTPCAATALQAEELLAKDRHAKLQLLLLSSTAPTHQVSHQKRSQYSFVFRDLQHEYILILEIVTSVELKVHARRNLLGFLSESDLHAC